MTTFCISFSPLCFLLFARERILAGLYYLKLNWTFFQQIVFSFGEAGSHWPSLPESKFPVAMWIFEAIYQQSNESV